jgi:hypothetical protein
VLLLFQLSPYGGAIGHAARSGGHSCNSCEPKPFCSPFTPPQQSFARRSAPPHPPHHLLAEQSVPIGDSAGSNGSLAMPALLRLPSWRLPFTGFLRRSLNPLACRSDTLRDAPRFPLSLFFPELLLFSISSISTAFSLVVWLPHMFSGSPQPELPRESLVARLVATHCVSRGYKEGKVESISGLHP